MSLKIMSINMEFDKHLPLLEAFILSQRRPDVLCLQELYEWDIPFIERLMQVAPGSLAFVPVKRNAKDNHETFGLGIVARKGLRDVEDINLESPGRYSRRPYKNSKMREFLLAATVMDGKDTYRIATTHLRFTTYKAPTKPQLNSISNLLYYMENQVHYHGSLVLTGDLNAPRGQRAFTYITNRYLDAIPPIYTSSLDAARNAYPTEGMMVDALFHTRSYVVEDVNLWPEVSDHMAITATLSKRH